MARKINLTYKNIEWPWNLICDIFGDDHDVVKEIRERFKDDRSDLLDGIDTALSSRMDPRYAGMATARYRDVMTYAEIGKVYNVGPERARQIVRKTLRMIRISPRSMYIRYGAEGAFMKIKRAEEEKTAKALEHTRAFDEIRKTRLEELDLSIRAYNALKRAGLNTCADVIEYAAGHDEGLLRIRNMGVKSAKDIADAFIGKGFAASEDLFLAK